MYICAWLNKNKKKYILVLYDNNLIELNGDPLCFPLQPFALLLSRSRTRMAHLNKLSKIVQKNMYLYIWLEESLVIFRDIWIDYVGAMQEQTTDVKSYNKGSTPHWPIHHIRSMAMRR